MPRALLMRQMVAALLDRHFQSDRSVVSMARSPRFAKHWGCYYPDLSAGFEYVGDNARLQSCTWMHRQGLSCKYCVGKPHDGR